MKLKFRFWRKEKPVYRSPEKLASKAKFEQASGDIYNDTFFSNVDSINQDFTASDGTIRKSQYGSGKQPWDEIKELGWGAEFAAGNVLKYIKRIKDPEHDLESAQRYHEWLLLLMPLESQNDPEARRLRKIYSNLRLRLSPAQSELLGGM